MEAKDRKTAPAADAARKEEATSDETLAELEETQQIGGATTGAAGDTSDAGSAPAPDGTPDPDRGGGRADGGDTGGPM